MREISSISLHFGRVSGTFGGLKEESILDMFIPVIKYNFIKKCLGEISNALMNCVDGHIIETTKAYQQERIFSAFTDLTESQRALLNVSNIREGFQIEQFLKGLEPYIYGMDAISNETVSRLFRKEKKLKIPQDLDLNRKRAYLGWIDSGSRKLILIHKPGAEAFGMACRLPQVKAKTTNVCALCNRIGDETQVAFVSPVCKTAHLGPDAYKSLGFYICLDSEACNDRITSLDKLEELLSVMNNVPVIR